MTVSTSAWFDVVTALLATFRADSVLTANQVNIIDGPVLLNAAAQNTLIVGGTSDPQQAGPGGIAAGDFTQQWGETGARARYEVLNVICELVVRNGSVDLAATRTTMQTLLAEIESVLRTGFTLGVGRLMWAEVLTGQISQMQAQTGGSSVSVTFNIAAKARLASL